MPDTVQLLELFERVLGPDARATLLAWARLFPVVTIVPAFGLAAVSIPIRVGLSLALAIAVAPALRPLVAGNESLIVLLLREAAFGLPVALGAAAFLWAAIMAGGLVDNLRGARDEGEVPLLDEPATPLAAFFGLLVVLAFLETGGVGRVAQALSDPRLSTGLGVAAERLAQSMSLAVAIAAPLAVTSIVVEAASGLVARAATPAYVFSLFLPIRSLALLVMLWLSLDRIVELLVVLAARPV
jgi:type III secretory pathway component EscT